MWYFAWILGVLLACSFGLINALWLEVIVVTARSMRAGHGACRLCWLSDCQLHYWRCRS